MEEFLSQIDLGNLRSMIENDSDYGDEVDMAPCDRASQLSKSAKSNIKSPKWSKQQRKQASFHI